MTGTQPEERVQESADAHQLGTDRSRLGLLRDHDFGTLFASTTATQLGHHITLLALPLVAVLTLEASAFQVGLLSSVTLAAFLLIGLPAGAWVDRVRKRGVLVMANIGRAGLLLSIPTAWWLELLTIWQLYAVALLGGVAQVFFDVAYQSYLPHLVGRANLVEANAKLESVRALSQLGGPAGAGHLIQVLTAPVALVVSATSQVVSAALVLRIRKPERVPPRDQGASLMSEIGEGLRFVIGHRLLRAIAASTTIFSFFSSGYTAMLVLFLARELKLQEGAIGVIFTVAGIGGVAGSLTARRISTFVGQGPAIWMAIAFTAPLGILMPLAQPGVMLWIAAAGQLIVTAGLVVYNVAQVSFRQRLTPNQLLGRVNATMRFLAWGTMPIGALLGGLVGQSFGVRVALWVGAVGWSLAFLPVLLSPLRSMKVLPTTSDL